MALPNLSNLAKRKSIKDIPENRRVKDESGQVVDINNIQEGEEYFVNNVRYMIYKGKPHRIGKGARVIRSIPPTTYDGFDDEGNAMPQLMVPDIDEQNLHKEIKKFFR